MPVSGELRLKEIDAAYFLCKSALFLFFISDACNKILLFLHYDFYRVSIFFRSAYEILFFFLIILFINEVRLLFLKIFFIVFLLFFTGQLLFSSNFYDYKFSENIFNFNKWFFIFIIYFSIYKLRNYADKFQDVINILENIFFINSIAIIIGFTFQISFLRTYLQEYRYGYDGFIPAQNEATFFYFIAIAYFYYKHFILNIKSKKLYFILFSSIFLGTKGIYVFLVLLLIFHFLYHSNLKTKLIALVSIISIVLGVMWFLNTGTAQVLLGYFISQSQKTNWWEMIMSGRNVYISTYGTTILNNWNIINYFVGGQDQVKLAIEMDFIDLFFFLGIIGASIFTALYFSTIFRFNILRPFNFFFLFSFTLLAFFSGHFFFSAINALYLCLISMYFYQTQHAKDIIS